MRHLIIAVALAICAPATAQEGASSTPTREEWVMMLEPTLKNDAPITLAPQRFASEQDCKALAKQLYGSVYGKCLRARLIVPSP